MSIELKISNKEGVADIEFKMSELDRKLTRDIKSEFVAKISSDRRATFFKDIWTAMALATGLDNSQSGDVVAWGLQNWLGLSEIDGFALSHPCLLAMQRGAAISTDRFPRERLDVEEVQRQIFICGGVLGEKGARFRTVVELDSEFPRAAVLTDGLKAKEKFFDFVRRALFDLEIGARAGGVRSNTSARAATLEWLFELHTNGYEHARRDKSVRFIRLQKHQFPSREEALKHAKAMPDLLEYLMSQDERPSNRKFNIVEASVSDFGAGILDGFLSTYAGEVYKDKPRIELLDKLLHEQLSCKSSDPNAGLGIRQALRAARNLDAFVSLRTAEFSLCMQGQLAKVPRLTFQEGIFGSAVGTHWQLLLPDVTEGK
jgi:hypothetical protein